MSLLRSPAFASMFGLLLTGLGAAAAPCDAPAHREFDFWIGEWQVHTPDGKLAGINRIAREHGGCVIHERYETSRGYSGASYNIYDAGRKVWHQSWVDSAGTLLLLEGRFESGSMVLEGRTTSAQGEVTRHRISWTPGSDGSVRQHWQTADAAGAEWKTAFDGRYTKK